MNRMLSESRPALVLAGHGSHRNPYADQAIYRHGDRIRRFGIFHEVREAFWKEEPEFFRVLPMLESERVIIVPLFMSNGYFVQQVLPREFGVTDPRNSVGGKPVHLARPVGTHPDLSGIIISRACAMLNRRVPAHRHGLALIGHGTSRNPDSRRSLQDQAERVRARRIFSEMHTLFLDDQPRVGQLPEMFSCEDVLVIPLFISDGQHTLHDIPELLGLHHNRSPRELLQGESGTHRLRYARALGNDPRMARLILQRVQEVAESAGYSSLRPFLRHAISGLIPGNSQGESGRKAPSAVLSDPGLLVRKLSVTPGRLREKQPVLDRLLWEARKGIRFDALSVTASGETFSFKIPGREETGLSPEALREIGAKHFEYISDWDYWTRGLFRHRAPRWHFLRWLEYADILSVPARYGLGDSGHLRAWGELLITTHIGFLGKRLYEIRHRKDLFRAAEELTDYIQPTEARQIAKYDAEGAYRPLKSSPSLRSGWRFSALHGHQVYRVIEAFYPATIDDWYRERTHRTAITHFRDRAARQSGMYGRLTELHSEQLAGAVKETCCDRYCLKRRLWQESESREIHLSCGEGLLPCPAPCSVLMEAARHRISTAKPNNKRNVDQPGKLRKHQSTTDWENAKEHE